MHAFSLVPTWRKAIPAFLAVLCCVLFLFRETAWAMGTIWARSDTFAHGFLVPPISLWLAWRQRAALAALTPKPGWAALLPMAAAAAAWLLGDLAAVNAVTQLSLVALLVLCVPVVLGWAVAQTLMFPLGFLFFAAPVGEFMLPQLMEWTADFTIYALRFSGIPVYREGLQFVIPSGSWSVIEACSGVRYLIASLTVGTLFAYLNYQSMSRRWVFVGVSIAVPIIANWLRAYMIVMLGHLSDNRLAVGVDHLIYGWVFFGVVIMIMFLIGSRWAEPGAHPPNVQPVASGAPALPAERGVWASAATAIALAVLPHVALWSMVHAGPGGSVALLLPRELAAGWQSTAPPLGGFKPQFQNPSAEAEAAYAKDGRAVGVYIGYYRGQNYERKLVSSTNVLVGSRGSDWMQVATGSRALDASGGLASVHSAELRSLNMMPAAADARLLVWQVYWLQGRWTTSAHLAKVYGVLDRLLGRGDDGAVLVVYAVKEGSGRPDTVLADFLRENLGAIEALLARAHGGD